MGKYKESISDRSLWITATPTPLAKTLPFFIAEAGHFLANADYRTKRDMHDSFLLLYTVRGQGIVRTEETVVPLTRGAAVVIDCHIPHEYYAVSGQWEFLWIHFNGSGVMPLFEIAYPNDSVCAVYMKEAEAFEKKMNSLINLVRQNDTAAYLTLSSEMHSLLGAVSLAALEKGGKNTKTNEDDDVRAVVEYIEKNYSYPITVEDMIREIPVSKYYFIRRFGRVMGITPYSYLTNYRINISKMLLRSTDKSVTEIAEACGFLDTSNFITHFKKHTGQKPLQYRRDFS